MLGVLEVKTNLTTGSTGEFATALRHCATVKTLNRVKSTGISFLDHAGEFLSCPYILFAYEGPKPNTALKLMQSMKAKVEAINPKCGWLGSMPDLVVVLSHDYALAKTASWVQMGATAASAFRRGNPARCALFHLYSFVLGLVDHWGQHMSDFRLPQSEYFDVTANLQALFPDDD